MTEIVEIIEHTKYPNLPIFDLVFLSGERPETNTPAWSSEIGTNNFWPKYWLPNESLLNFNYRIFKVSCVQSHENWLDQFPFLETSKIILHSLSEYKKRSDATHYILFFASGVDTFLLEQIFYTATLDKPDVCIFVQPFFFK